MYRLSLQRRVAHRRTIRVLAAVVILGCVIPEAGAVFTFTALGTPRRITMQVGSTNTTINNVTFNVTNAALFLNPTPVTGTPGNGTPATTPANGTEIRVTTRFPNSGTSVNLTVDSSAGLTCVGGTGCGTTGIPFNTVSWTSYNHDATYPTFDIQDGTFSGSASQPLTGFTVTGASITMSNVLIYQYSNSTLFPSGKYTGRVTYTATIP